MPTEEIRFFIQNILNRGNMLGIERAVLDVYLAEGIKSDKNPDVLLCIDSYTVFGGFLEVLFAKMVKDAEGRDVRGAKWVIDEYNSFVSNIKNYEREILERTKKYFEKINNIADALRKLGRKIKVHLSEISSGIELYLSGRYEIVKDHITRKINELSAEGLNEVIFISPFEYSLYNYGYLSQASTSALKIDFFAEYLIDKNPVLKVPNKISVAIFDPYLAPVSMFRSDIRSGVVKTIECIERLLANIANMEIVDKKYDGAPIGYEQLWMINPLTSISLSKNILDYYNEKVDVIITARTSTAMILEMARTLYGLGPRIYEYSDFVSRIILGMEI